MRRNKWFIGSVVGFFITLLCCATPLLVIFLGLLGLGAWGGYLDYILLPLLAVFFILAVSTYKKSKPSSANRGCCS
ncbi:mercury resistance system transport protein MerF [Halobacillus yeomjeoni]|uniref:mercury resistance system transport protein MerF n=1 Tax=Halobacillus yeomjeoni TaxID=311194 RepID=UPI001CD65ADD|nr:mercury resistance system transport protein MerF [Halobacillus yeomjeoni]MCA0984365.1 mercury resistance system transport protein MerF [Halobacillus yeomjeoni]